MGSSVQHFAESSQAHERRISQRILPKTLIYVACCQSNGGMVLNVSDDGLAVSMAIAVGDEAYSHLTVRMNGLPQSIEVPGRMVWTTKSKKRAGVQLIDVSDIQREQIREWIALEGVRDVNLSPRIVADDVISSRAITADAVNPMVFAEPRSTLLDAFGGTTPETLGPPLPELFASPAAAPAAAPLASQGFDDVRTAAFREDEWDLASVTMVPRTKPKPEGLSALALILLWIAIPSFAIGILVGRRPLEQWLSRGEAVGKTLPRKSPSPTLSSPTSALPASEHQTEVKFSQEIPPNLPINTEPFQNGLVIKPAETYRSGSSGLVDAQLLNSTSTQEVRAFKKNVGPGSAASTTPNKNNADKRPVNAVNDSAASAISQSETAPTRATVKLSTVPAGSASVVTSASAKPQDTSSAPVTTSATSNPTIPKTDGASESTTVHQNYAVPGARPSLPPATVPISTSATASPSNPDLNRNASPSVLSRNSAATSTAATTATTAPSNVTSAAPVNPSVAPSVAPNNAPKSASLSIQPPLRGVMNIARSTDQAFVLKLPAESVPGGQAASMRMQRFVMVPQRGRWHHSEAVAKLTVGELLTQVLLEKPDAKVQPQPGDTVTVRAFVDKQGAVRDLKPVSGRFALMPRVMRTVREWQFDQTLVDGKPVESEVNVTVEYRGAN